MTPADLYDDANYRATLGNPIPESQRGPYSRPGPMFGGGAGAIFRGRTESLARVTAGLEALVEERERLRDEVLSAIDRDDSALSNLLLAMYRPGIAGTDNPAYLKLRVEQLRLERERRQAAVDCWRDTALIAKDLVEQAEGTNEAARLEKLLGGFGS